MYMRTLADELMARSRCDITINLLINGVLGHSTMAFFSVGRIVMEPFSSFLCLKVTFWMFVLFRHNDKVELVVSAHLKSSIMPD